MRMEGGGISRGCFKAQPEMGMRDGGQPSSYLKPNATRASPRCRVDVLFSCMSGRLAQPFGDGWKPELRDPWEWHELPTEMFGSDRGDHAEQR